MESNQVQVSIVENCSQEQLIPIIQDKILKGSTINTYGQKAYEGLILNRYDHYRIFHSKNEFTRGKNHVNKIESFQAFAKRRMVKFNCLTEEKFILYLKECKFRWNNKGSNLNNLAWKSFKRY